ncbi:hypothetical protein Bbelb_276490 [Branchiostoma belcheri]|nr:hypothetical protein Bbelb_276490 [Branchiostoma belcheri]
MASNILICYFVFATEEMNLLHVPTICRLKGQHRNKPGHRRGGRARLEAAHPGLDLEARVLCLKRPAGSSYVQPRLAPLHSRPGCTPRPRYGLTAITTNTITTPSRRQTGGSLSFQDENRDSEAPGAGRGVAVEGAVGSRERAQQGPGNGSNGSGNGSNRTCTGLDTLGVQVGSPRVLPET